MRGAAGNHGLAGARLGVSGLYPLRAIGIEFCYAPNYEPLPADPYQISLDQGRVTALQVATVVNGVGAAHDLTFMAIGPAGGFPLSYTASQLTRIYADGGTTVTFRAQRDIGGDGVVHATISGYLVNVP